MTFGDYLKLAFEAHYEDLASNTSDRYLNTHLKQVYKIIPDKFRKHIVNEFCVIKGVITSEILTCPHPKDRVTSPWQYREECKDCGACRHSEAKNDWNDTYREWTQWKLI